MQEATPWIQVALNLIDMMGKVAVKPEVRFSLRSRESILTLSLVLPLDRSKVEENPG
jgi:hypothetical protein